MLKVDSAFAPSHIQVIFLVFKGKMVTSAPIAQASKLIFMTVVVFEGASDAIPTMPAVEELTKKEIGVLGPVYDGR